MVFPSDSVTATKCYLSALKSSGQSAAEPSAQADGSHARIAYLDGINRAVNKENLDLKKQIVELKGKIDALSTENDAARKDNGDAVKTMELLIAQNGALKDSLNWQQGKINKVEANNIEVHGQLAVLKCELDSQRQRMLNVQAESARIQAADEKWKEMAVGEAVKISALKTKNEELQRELDGVVNGLVDAEREMDAQKMVRTGGTPFVAPPINNMQQQQSWSGWGHEQGLSAPSSSSWLSPHSHQKLQTQSAQHSEQKARTPQGNAKTWSDWPTPLSSQRKAQTPDPPQKELNPCAAPWRVDGAK